MIDEDQDTPAKLALEEAIERLMSEGHETNVVLSGYIIQAVGQSAEDRRDLLTYTGKTGQSGIVTQGLLSYINQNADMVTFGEDDDD